MSEVDRLKELINKNETRIRELGKSIEEALNSYSEESKRILIVAERVDENLEEADKRISEYDAQVTSLEEKRQGLKSETGFLEQKIREAEKRISSITSEINSTNKDVLRIQDNIKQFQTKIDAARTDLEKYEKEIDELEKGIEDTRQSNEKEFNERNTAYTDALKKTKELSEKEPIMDFLLTEASSEPPEIPIVAKLITESGLANIDDLKKTTKVPPAIALRTISTLEQKGIVEKPDEKQVKLKKTLPDQ